MSRANSKPTSGFDPRSVTGCELWLDAADASTLFADTGGSTPATIGGTIGMWKDKSGNSHNYTATLNPSIPPAYSSLGSITFDQGNCLINNDIWAGNGASVDIFVVSTPWNEYSKNGDWRTLLRGNNAGHRVIIEAGTQKLGFYANSTTGFNQFGSLTQGQVQSIIYVKIDSSYNSSAAINGTITLSTASNTQNSDSQPFYALGAVQGGPGQPWGVINELLIYTNLTLPQRQQIEGYLAWKWNLNGVLPPEHPMRLSKPFARRFNPTDIEGCALWLDGADGSTMSLSGTSVMSWTDKVQQLTFNALNSGYYPTLQTGGGVLFSNSSSVITPSSQGLFTHNQWILPTQNITLFCASYPLSVDSYRNACFFGTNAYTGSSLPNFLMSIEMGNSGDSTNVMLFDYNSSFWSQNITAATNTTSAPRVDVLVSSAGATSGWNFINGTENSYSGSNAYTSSYTNYPVNVSYLGAFTSSVQGNRSFNGPIYEIIVYKKALSVADRQRVEGYLANKWKFAANLITGHPFRGFPSSSIVPFSPLNIPNCVLWLDAADASTIARSGNTLTSWTSKGSATASSSPRYGTASTGTTFQNGNNVLVFPAGTDHTISFAIPTQAHTWFWVAQCTTTLGGGTPYWSVFNQTQGNGQSCPFGPGAPSGGENTYIVGTGPSGIAVLVMTDTAPNPYSYGVYAIQQSAVSTSLNAVTVNGGLQSLISNGTAYAYPSDVRTYSINTSSYSTGANICEILLYSGEMTSAQRKVIEGYLAWKWGKQGSLPSSHPSRKFSPAHQPGPVVEGGSGGGGTTVDFTFTGGDQTWPCPPGVTSITVTLNGAGGGNGYGSNGGYGGLVSGTLAVTPGTTYTIIVGQGGGSGWFNPYGGGGTSGVYGYGSQGGGRSAIAYGGSDLVTAGAGGGSAYYTNGGAGGGNDGGYANGSGGGGQYGGGYPSTSYGAFYYDGSPGGQYYGGNGGYYYGSGGGGGWYGGGGGGYYNQAGAGGSSYVGGLTGIVVNTQGGGSASGVSGSVTIVY